MRMILGILLAGLAPALLTLGGPARPAPAGTGGAGGPAEFAPPETILDGSGHGAALRPHYADFDGDGAADQLVGVGGRLLVSRNRGTSARPAYAAPAWFDAAEPSARIPGG